MKRILLLHYQLSGLHMAGVELDSLGCISYARSRILPRVTVVEYTIDMYIDALNSSRVSQALRYLKFSCAV